MCLSILCSGFMSCSRRRKTSEPRLSHHPDEEFCRTSLIIRISIRMTSCRIMSQGSNHEPGSHVKRVFRSSHEHRAIGSSQAVAGRPGVLRPGITITIKSHASHKARFCPSSQTVSAEWWFQSESHAPSPVVFLFPVFAKKASKTVLP